MSFGFSVGDFITIIQLANKVRKEFVEAPVQFKEIVIEVKNLSSVLEDVKNDLSSENLSGKQKSELQELAESCRNVLLEIEKTISKYRVLDPANTGKRNMGKRAWKRLKWEPEDIQKLRNRISSNVSLLNAFYGRITRSDVLKLKQYHDDQERKAILDWLSPVNYASQHVENLNQRQPGSGEWLLKSVEFRNWVEMQKQTLLCHGIPGAGKTVLTSIMIDELYMRYENDVDIGIAFIYFDMTRHREQRLEDMFSSLLRQLAHRKPALPAVLKDQHYQSYQQGARLSLDELSSSLHYVVSQFSKVYIIIDALDECQSSFGPRDMLLSKIFGLQEKYDINFLATSRPIPEIQLSFEGKPCVKIEASSEDVQSYLKSRLRELPKFVGRSAELQNHIVAQIANVIDGMFLLAKLHIDSLIGKQTVNALRITLEDLPVGSNAYDSAYESAMKRIQAQVSDQAEMAIKLLSWITCAEQPLNVIELRHALAVEIGQHDLDQDNLPDIEDMVSACAGLVTVDEQSCTVRLIHYTTQQYFERTWIDWFPKAHQLIADVCVTYLSFEIFEIMWREIYEELIPSMGKWFKDKDSKSSSIVFKKHLESVKRYPLYIYSAQYWGTHSRHQQGNTEICRRFLLSPVKVAACTYVLTRADHDIYNISHINYGPYGPPDLIGINLAAYFGLDDMVQELINRGVSVAARSTNVMTPLSFAAMKGHESTVILLLNKDVNPDIKNLHGQTPLVLAIKYYHESVIKLLLERGADIEAKDNDGRTPLSVASKYGYELAVNQLIDMGADIEARDNSDQTPLVLAIEYHHESVMKLLLQKGADIEARDDTGCTPLFAASKYGYELAVNQLIDMGAAVEARDNRGRTALFAASKTFRVSVMKLLLQKGADIEARDNTGCTPLIAASGYGCESVVNQLIDMGADIEARDNRGRTALFAASMLAEDSIFKLLVKQGADPMVKDIDGMTALSAAFESRDSSTIRNLLILSGDFFAHKTLPSTLVWKKDVTVLEATLRNMGLAEDKEFFRISHSLFRIRANDWLYIKAKN